MQFDRTVAQKTFLCSVKIFIYFTLLKLRYVGHLADPVVGWNGKQAGEDDSNAVATCDDVHSKLLSGHGDLPADPIVGVDVS